MDPPFGGRLEALAVTLQRIAEDSGGPQPAGKVLVGTLLTDGVRPHWRGTHTDCVGVCPSNDRSELTFAVDAPLNPSKQQSRARPGRRVPVQMVG